MDFTFQQAAQTEKSEKKQPAYILLFVSFWESVATTTAALSSWHQTSAFFFFLIWIRHVQYPFLFSFSHSSDIWNWARKEESSTSEPHSRLTLRLSVSQYSSASSSSCPRSPDHVSVFSRNRHYPSRQPWPIVRTLWGLHCLPETESFLIHTVDRYEALRRGMVKHTHYAITPNIFSKCSTNKVIAMVMMVIMMYADLWFPRSHTLVTSLS